jgi:acyl-CoA reductase-like NAD-dependent aldehyde dehydrogenase
MSAAIDWDGALNVIRTLASARDIDIAVASSRKAFNGPWRQLAPTQRGKLLFRLADLMERVRAH